MSFHRFVKNSSKKETFSSKKKHLEQTILGNTLQQSFVDDCNDDVFSGKKFKKMLGLAGEIVSNSKQSTFLDINILMAKLEKTVISRVACSSRHSLVVTNTGAVFAWGENDSSQLGYETSKKNKGKNYESKPRKIETLQKEFIIDVACGE